MAPAFCNTERLDDNVTPIRRPFGEIAILIIFSFMDVKVEE